jgi:hypothetical protein
MGAAYAPDARNAFDLQGPMIRELPFHRLGPVQSARASALLVLAERKQDEQFVVLSIAVDGAPSGVISFALHHNLTPDHARRIGAQMIAAANHLDAAAGVQ